jgi:CDP-ribitol ribitolphosphotransferase
MDQKNSFNGNLKYLKEEIGQRGNFQYSYLSKEEYLIDELNSINDYLLKLYQLLKFFLVKTYKLAVSRYVFLNDNFFPIAYMNFNKDAVVTQIWHAPGAFKKFGKFSTEDMSIRSLIDKSGLRINYLIVSSKNIAIFYEDAFSVESKKILPLGTPRIDYYFKLGLNNLENKEFYNNVLKIREKFEKKYPEIVGKKIILYTPTFRENKKFNEEISDNFDFQLFNKELGKKYCLLFRSHPKIRTSKPKHSIDVSNYPDEKELLVISDILITDYSSIMIEYAILLKPIIFYPFDFEYYNNEDRGFYFDYKNVPGPIAKNTEELIQCIKNNDFDFDKIKNFLKNQHDYLDGKSSKRIIDHIFQKSN